MLKLGEEAGFGPSVVYRARKLLEGTVVDTRNRHAPGNRWVLAQGE
jgi:hypothetical protein